MMRTGIAEVLELHEKGRHDSLIPILQEIQERVGYLSEDAIVEVGKHLDIPSSRIYGVATFYNQFRFQPTGRYHIQVCRGTACHVLGSATVLEHIEKLLNIKAGQTSRDGLFSIEVVACIGACGLAPVICVNGEFHARVDEATVGQIIGEYRKMEEKP